MKTLPLYMNNICLQTVASMFASFQDPAMRGPKFDWKNFPEMAARHCENQCFLNTNYVISTDRKRWDRHMKQAHEFGIMFATRLLQESKVLNDENDL